MIRILRVSVEMLAYFWLVQVFARSYSLGEVKLATIIVQFISQLIEQWYILLGFAIAFIFIGKNERQRIDWMRLISLTPLSVVLALCIVLAHQVVDRLTNDLVIYVLFMLPVTGVAILELWYLSLPASLFAIISFMAIRWPMIRELFE